MPTAVIYVAAAVTTVAAVLAFKEFVYDPHIAPFLEDVRAQHQESRRQRAAPHRTKPRPPPSDSGSSDDGSGGDVHDYTRAPRDEKAERARRAAAADAWRRLSESVAELDSLREKADASGSGVDAAPSSAGLRRRTAGPMDESIESILFAPMSPTPSRGVRSPPPRPASPDETLFSASTLSSPEFAPRPLSHSPSPPRTPSPGPRARVLSPDPFADGGRVRSPDVFSDGEVNPWVTDDAPSLASSAVFMSPPLPAMPEPLDGSELLMPSGVLSPRSALAGADVLSPFTHASAPGTDVDDLSLLDEDEAFSVASLSDHGSGSDSDGEPWTEARREAHL